MFWKHKCHQNKENENVSSEIRVNTLLAGHPLVCSDPLRNVEPITQTVWDTFGIRKGVVPYSGFRTNAFCYYLLWDPLLFTFTMAMMIKTSNIIESKVISCWFTMSRNIVGDTYLIRSQSPIFTSYLLYFQRLFSNSIYKISIVMYYWF